MTVQTIARPGAVSVNPATGQETGRFPWLDSGERDAALSSAVAGHRAWRALSVEDRASVLTRVGAHLRRHEARLARTMTEDMGKPLREARAEVEKCAHLCDWYAAHGPAFLADEATGVEGGKAHVSYRPLGVVLAVMPWNFPLWQAMRAAVPVMLAGNGVLLKHAPNVLRSADDLAEAFAAAGAPTGAFTLFNVDQADVAAAIADPRVAAVTVTASVRAGAAVAGEAGRHVKKSVLELGGADPFLVLADADIERAVAAAIQSRFQNCGQVCIAAKRIILEAPIAEDFTRRFVAAAKALSVGDPLDEANRIGPMARHDLRDELDEQVKRTIAEGATLLLGGRPIAGAGAYYEPTVLAGVTRDMTAFRQEMFGPVAALIVAADAEAAVDLANDSDFGLSGALWTADIARARRIAARLEVGGVFINGTSASDPRTPIGGVKKSGYGRELSHFGVREFTNAQLVWEDRR